MQDIAPILTALALCLSAIPGIIAAVISLLTRRIVVAQAAVVAVQTAKIEEVQKTADSVHEAVNSKMDKLLAVVKIAAHAEGVLEGKSISP